MKYDYTRIAVKQNQTDDEWFDERLRVLSANGWEIKTTYSADNGEYVEILLQRIIDATP